MKLRTKILWIAGLVLALAIGISDYAIWKICEHTLLKDATQSTYYEVKNISHELMNFLEYTEAKVDEVLIDYYFKAYGDNHTICVRDNLAGVSEALSNRTIFSLSDLDRMEWNSYQLNNNKESQAETTVISWKGMRLILVHYYASPRIHLYRVTETGDIDGQLNKLAIWMLFLAVVILGAGLVLMYGLLYRAFRPMQMLTRTAEHIAEGAYEIKADIKSTDEVGVLGESFNRMAAAAEQHIRELELSEERKTLFMGSLTHELKTPLTAISGYAQTMRAIKLSEEDTAEALEYIYKECGRLERLSGKMMRLLELEQGRDLEWKKIPVKQLFKMSEKSCRAIIDEKRIRLNIADTDAIIEGDIDLLTDVLVNLLDNAVKASSEGGSIWMFTEMNKAEGDDGEPTIVVRDCGKGIPEDEINRICEPFYMVDKSRSRKEGGAGLGLALTAIILKHHRMRLMIESTVGVGTRVSIISDGMVRENI